MDSNSGSDMDTQDILDSYMERSKIKENAIDDEIASSSPSPAAAAAAAPQAPPPQSQQQVSSSDRSKPESIPPKIIRPKAVKTEDLARAEAQAILRSKNAGSSGSSLQPSSMLPPPPLDLNSPPSNPSKTLLSLRPIALSHRDRCSSVDRQNMLLHMNVMDGEASSFESDYEDSTVDREDATSISTSTQRSFPRVHSQDSLQQQQPHPVKGNPMYLQPLPLDKFLRPRPSRISPQQQHKHLHQQQLQINSTAQITTTNMEVHYNSGGDDDSTVSDDESSYFSDARNRAPSTTLGSTLPLLSNSNLERKRNLPIPPLPATATAPSPPPPPPTSFNRFHSISSSNTSLSLSDSSDDENMIEEKQPSHSPEPFTGTRRKSFSSLVSSVTSVSHDTNLDSVLNSELHSDSDLDDDHDSDTSRTNSEILRASSYDKNHSNARMSPIERPSGRITPVPMLGDKKNGNAGIFQYMAKSDSVSDEEYWQEADLSPDKDHQNGSPSDKNYWREGESPIHNRRLGRSHGHNSSHSNSSSNRSSRAKGHGQSKNEVNISRPKKRSSRSRNSPPLFYGNVEDNRKNHLAVPQPKHLHYFSSSSISEFSPEKLPTPTNFKQKKNLWLQTQNQYPGQVMNQMGGQPNELHSPARKSSVGSTTIGPDSSFDSRDLRNGSKHHPNSPFASYQSGKFTLPMEYSSDEENESSYLDPEDSFTSNAVEHFSRTMLFRRAGNFLPPECQYTPSPRVDRKRWYMLFYMFLLNLLSEWTGYSVAPISTILSIHYSMWHASGLVSAFLLAKCIGTLMEPFILSKFGFRGTVLLGALLLWVGNFLKTTNSPHGYADFSFLRLYAAFIIVGISQPFYYCSIALLSSAWFPKSEWSKVTSIMLASGRLGICCAFFIGAVIINSRDDLAQYFDLLEWLSLIVLIGVAVQFEESPPTPPKVALSKSDEDDKKSKTNKSKQQRKTSADAKKDEIFRNDSLRNSERGNEEEGLLHDPPKVRKKGNMSRATTPSGQSIGPPSLYPGRAILMSSSEGTAPIIPLGDPDEKSPLWDVSGQYGSTPLILSNASPFPFKPSMPIPNRNNSNSLFPSPSQTAQTEPISSSDPTNPRNLRIQIRPNQIFISAKACLSCPGFVHSTVAFVLSSIIMNTLITYMSFLVQFALQQQKELRESSELEISNHIIGSEIPLKNWRFWTGLSGVVFQATSVVSSYIFIQYTDKTQSYYSTILGLLVLGVVTHIECNLSLTASEGWDIRGSMMIIAALVGPLRPISTKFGAELAHPLSQDTVLIIQELFANFFSAALIPLFQILRNVGISFQNGTQERNYDDFDGARVGNEENQYTNSFYYLMVIHIFAALFFATSFVGRQAHVEYGKNTNSVKDFIDYGSSIPDDYHVDTFDSIDQCGSIEEDDSTEKNAYYSKRNQDMNTDGTRRV